MNRRRPKTSQRASRRWTGAHSTPTAADDPVVAPSANQVEVFADPLGAGSQIVYCDNDQEVRKGFAIALRAMGLG